MRDDDITERVWDIITNVEAIAVNQAWFGHPGRQLKSWTPPGASANVDLWTKPVGEHGQVALLVLNTGEALAVDFSVADVLRSAVGHLHARRRSVGAEERRGGEWKGPASRGLVRVRDIWARVDRAPVTADSTFTVHLGKRDSAFLTFDPTGEGFRYSSAQQRLGIEA